MRWRLFSCLILVLTSSRLEAACIDPSELVRSTVNIVRIFDEQESRADAGTIGVAGTAWFLSPTQIVTAGHVSESMHLSDWKEVELWQGANKTTTSARLQRLVGSHAEKIAVLELRDPFPVARPLLVRTQPLAPNESVVSLAYPERRLRFAGGHFVRQGDEENYPGTALMEIYDGMDRLALDHGASGAAVLDCEGRVVAVVANILSQTIRFSSQVIRTSTPWQTPNVVAIPVMELADYPALR